MKPTKEDRDTSHNAGINESSTRRDAPFVQLSPGIEYQLLRVSQETGRWVVVFRCAAGCSFARHEHLGGGEYYMISGKMEIRGGKEKGGVTALAGDYGYEANGMIHDVTSFPEETVLYFSNDGPLKFIDDDNNVLSILDWRLLRDVYDAATKPKVASAAE